MYVISLKRIKSLAGTWNQRCHHRFQGQVLAGDTCVSLTLSVLPHSRVCPHGPRGCKCIRTDPTVPTSHSAIRSNQTMGENYYYENECTYKA